MKYSAAGIVLCGVIGEYVAEFTRWAADRGIEKKLSKISTLVLIIGIAGEGIGLFRTSQISGELIHANSKLLMLSAILKEEPKPANGIVPDEHQRKEREV